jgi:peptidoglycan L-alanyl-D-glutamate endopeptidase CwlK
MAFKLGKRSLANLAGVHPDLVKVITRAMAVTPLDFVVTEGVRTLERQRDLVWAGASQTMKSRHLTGHAVDLAAVVAGQVRWDWPLYQKLADVVQAAATELAVPVEWGGAWTTLKDGPHFQLPWAQYP